MADQAQGALAKIYVETGSGTRTYDAPTAEAYEFVSEGIQATQPILDTRGIRGTRSMPYERTRQGIRTVAGQIVMHPSPKDLDKWLPRIMGAAESANVFNLGDTFSEFGIYVDRVTEKFSYLNCRVGRATFRAQAGSVLEMTLDIVGTDEVVGVSAPSSAPSLGLTGFDQPFVFHDAQGAVNLPSVAAAEIFDLEIAIDNVINQRYVNSVTCTSNKETDRIVSVGITYPYDTDHNQSYRLPAGSRGLPGNILFTNPVGTGTLKFDFASLDGPDVSPTVQGKQEIVLRWDYIARSSGASLEVQITNVSS